MHRRNDGKCKEEVVSHGRRDSDWIIRKEGHEETPDRTDNAGCSEYGSEIHASRGKNRRLHEDDVRHRHECGEPGKDFGAEGGPGCGKVKGFLEKVVHEF